MPSMRLIPFRRNKNAALGWQARDAAATQPKYTASFRIARLQQRAKFRNDVSRLAAGAERIAQAMEARR